MGVNLLKNPFKLDRYNKQGISTQLFQKSADNRNMNFGLTLDPRVFLDVARLMAHLDGISIFKSPMAHPFLDHVQQTIVGPVVHANRQFYSKYDSGTQASAAVATSVFQTSAMIPAGFLDTVGALLTENPETFAKGFFADTMNMVFSLGTRSAKMTTQGVNGGSVFDRTLGIANLTTEVVLASAGIKSGIRSTNGLGPRLNSIAESLTKKIDQHSISAPAAALVDGGLMMATDNHIIEGATDIGAISRKAALHADLQLPTPGLRANGLTGTLELLAQAGVWDDFVYAVDHAFRAAAEVLDKEAALQLQQTLAHEVLSLLPEELHRIPNAKIRKQLVAIIEREQLRMVRSSQLRHLLEDIHDQLVGWERAMHEPLSMTGSSNGVRLMLWIKKMPGAVWIASLFSFSFKPAADAPLLPAPAEKPPGNLYPETPSDKSSIGSCPEGFAYIRAGSFTMGSQTVGLENERPPHQVNLDAYCIARTEVTNEAYQKITGKLPSPKNCDAPQQPVVSVGWNDADAYCQAIGGSLPTEAQWERAARGPRGFSYGTSSGTLDKEEANYNSKGSVAVGSYEMNGYGLYDMAGNVAEWCQDWYVYNYYAGQSYPRNNPTGPATGDEKVFRGGSFIDQNQWSLRASYRRGYKHKLSYLGFRCAALPKDTKR